MSDRRGRWVRGAGAERESGLRAPRKGEVVGRITIVQEDRIRVMDDEGHGYLFVVRKRAASLRELEVWRDDAVRVRIEYEGEPDAGAVAKRVQPLGPGAPG